MHIIKKYANRKLYHTNQKQYITLDGIAKLVQDGEAVQVLDNETGEDITPSILAQVVLHVRGRTGPQLPTQMLTGLIQLGGDTLANVRRTLFFSFGGDDLVHSEIERRLALLVNAGELGAAEGDRLRDLLLRKEFSQGGDQKGGERAAEMPSQNDVVRLHAQVDALTQAVDRLLREQHK
ncbi:MAG: pesticidal protein Cry15Aa [Chloroflexi bacterium]|nr:pesticidal protein Cry15Aa [Chloroflexota bacterium]